MTPAMSNSDRIRILHLVTAYGTAGMESKVAQVVNGCDPSRFSFVLCSLRPHRGGIQRLAPHVTYVDLRSRPGLDLSVIQELVRLMRAHRIDVVHSHNWGTLFYGVVSAWWAGVSTVVHGEHGREAAELNGLPLRRRLLRRWLAGRCAQLVTVTQELRRELVEDWGVGPAKVRVIYNGVDLDLFDPRVSPPADLREEWGIEPEDLVVGSVGRFRPVKNFGFLLEAFAVVAAAVPRARLVLVGGGGLDAQLKAAARALGLVPRVIFPGSRGDVHRWMALFDVFVLPSLYEGMSNTILEAMASGRPVVATRVGGNPELIEDGVSGDLCPPDRDAFAGRIIDLLTDPGRRAAYGRAGRARAEQRHALATMIEANEALYLALRDAGPSRAIGKSAAPMPGRDAAC